MARLPIPSNVIYIGLALGLAVITSLLFNNAVNKKPDAPIEAPEAIETSPVVVARRELLPGQRLTAVDVKTVDWPLKAGLSDEDVYTETDDVLNNVTKATIYPNEPIFRYKLVGQSSRGGLPVVIPEGKRAVTVGVSETIGVAGFIRPGDWVDVLTTLNDSEEGGTPLQLTRTVLQHVQVLAIAQTMSPAASSLTVIEESEEADDEDGNNHTFDAFDSDDDSDNPNAKLVASVTLALDPKDVEKCILADEIGSIRLVLRGEVDQQSVTVPGISRNELLGLNQRRGSVRPSLGNSTDVEFYNGEERQVLKF